MLAITTPPRGQVRGGEGCGSQGVQPSQRQHQKRETADEQQRVGQVGHRFSSTSTARRSDRPRRSIAAPAAPIHLANDPLTVPVCGVDAVLTPSWPPSPVGADAASRSVGHPHRRVTAVERDAKTPTRPGGTRRPPPGRATDRPLHAARSGRGRGSVTGGVRRTGRAGHPLWRRRTVGQRRSRRRFGYREGPCRRRG